MPEYKIETKEIPYPSKRSSGQRISKVKFIVLHDTGNPGATAQNNVDYYIRTRNEQSSSAHLFVDDKQILMCIDAFSKPKKAWHVQYNKTKDNQLFGDDANDCAIGVELCYGGKINNEEAYKRYVWLVAYLLKYHGLSDNAVVSHKILDPTRRSDPDNALSKMGKTYQQLISDIKNEYNRIDVNGNYIKPMAAKPTIAKVEDMYDMSYLKGYELEGLRSSRHPEELLPKLQWAMGAHAQCILILRRDFDLRHLQNALNRMFPENK